MNKEQIKKEIKTIIPDIEWAKENSWFLENLFKIVDKAEKEFNEKIEKMQWRLKNDLCKS